ncbi:MAG: iron-sulfur cluster assembly scaffold protein [Candidatus Nanohaloarchaea archaeon]|nr:iron-sulfur cluster assembly scaffold protein [Candidatus Nanohaloarchaea archaeon]
MNRQLYEGKILEHYREPRHTGTVDDPDATVAASNPHCGDDFTFTAAVDGGRVTELRFDGAGCALSTAAASLLTDEMIGEPVDALADIPEEDVFRLVGIEKDEIAPPRVKCVLLARRALADIGDML